MNKTTKAFYKNNHKRGIVGMIVILVIALLVLSYFGFNLRQTVDSPTTQSNFSYVWSSIVYIWQTYLQTPARALYEIFIQFIWTPIINHLMHLNTTSTGTGTN